MSDLISSNSWVKKTLQQASKSNFSLSHENKVKIGVKCTSIFTRIYNFFTMNKMHREFHYSVIGEDIWKKFASTYNHQALEKLPQLNWVRAVVKNSRSPPIVVARSIQKLNDVQQSEELKKRISNFIRAVLSNIYPDLSDLQCLELLPQIFDQYDSSTDKKMSLYNLAETLVGRYFLTQLRANEGSQLTESVWTQIKNAVHENNVKIHSKNGFSQIHALVIGIETNFALLSQSDEKLRLLTELRSTRSDSEKKNEKVISEMSDQEILQELQDHIVKTSIQLLKNGKNDYQILVVDQEQLVDNEEIFQDEQLIAEKPRIRWNIT